MNLVKSWSKYSILILIFILSCGSSKKDDSYDSKLFNDYWYGGKAEITSYKLKQARYGEIHDGHAVLIFVTEDLSLKKHVKLDDPLKDKYDAVKVLKLNFIKKFNTGIYRYSMMDSVFTPVNIQKYPYTLKETSSSQEWCGNTFMQLNLRDDMYQVRQYSYFESEGDRKFTLRKAFLEDGLWNKIRIDPNSLPVGNIKIVPGTMSARFTHEELKIEDAEASIEESPENIMNYTLRYEDLGRTLVIRFNKNFPFEIISWEQTYKSGWGDNANLLTTKATKNKSLTIDYWNKNKIVDAGLRKKLGLNY